MAIDPSTIKVALIAGGTSGEREISLSSAEGAREALREAGFSVTQIDTASKTDLVRLLEEGFDVAFLCLHGKQGEDGTVQGMLEIMGIPYTGPGVWSSATAMDKARSKVFYQLTDVPTPPSVTLWRGDPYQVNQLLESVGPRVVVKPATEGSALGVSIVDEEESVQEAIEAAFEIDNEILVEKFIEGRELTVAVIGNDELQALPVIEIVPRNSFYDFESKYAPGGSEHICPAELDQQTTRLAQELATRAHRALDCRGMSRTDIMLDTDGELWVLETNTIPGMTSTSLLPDAARAAGITFPQLCTTLIELALEGVA